jgi:hypothetical protein
MELAHHTLHFTVREQADRDASLTVATIHSQSIKSAKKEGLHSPLRL